MSSFISSFNCQHLYVLSHTSLNNFNRKQSYSSLSKELDFFLLKNSVKFSLSKFHLLCFASMAFARSLYVSSGEINTDRKIERQVQRVVCSRLVVHKYIDKGIISCDETYKVSFKMSSIQGTM